MSKVAIKGNASGTATFTIEAPVGVGTDRTLVLPDEAGTVLTSASTIPEAQMFSGFANGITELDMYRLSANVNGPSSANQNEILDSNWERVDTDNFSKIGTGMTEASGLFTFPSTGVYMVLATFSVQLANSNSARYFYSYTEVSSNSGSSFSKATGTLNSVPNVTSSTDFASTSTTSVVNVTDASTFRVRFSITTDATNLEVCGASTENQSMFTFMRIGDSQ